MRLQQQIATTSFEIPDGSSPVGTCRVCDDPSTLLVSYPPGWQREVAGHYVDAEEFIVLAGALALDEEVHRAGTWVLVPGKSPREGTRSPEGALALAWFDDGARWSTGDRPGAHRSAHVDLARASRTSGATPFGPGRTLRRRRSWWVTDLVGGPTDVTRQVVTSGGGQAPLLITAEPGEALPPVEGACFVRTTAEVR